MGLRRDVWMMDEALGSPHGTGAGRRGFRGRKARRAVVGVAVAKAKAAAECDWVASTAVWQRVGNYVVFSICLVMYACCTIDSTLLTTQ